MSYSYPGYNAGGSYPGASSYPGGNNNNNNNNNQQQHQHHGHSHHQQYPQHQGGAASAYPGNSSFAGQYPGQQQQHHHSHGQPASPHGSPHGQPPNNNSFAQHQQHNNSGGKPPASPHAVPQQQQIPPNPSPASQYPRPQEDNNKPSFANYPSAKNQYPTADSSYQHRTNGMFPQGQPTSQSSPMLPISAYFGSNIGKLPEIHNSDSSADPDKPLDYHEYLRGRGFKDEQILAARHEHVDPEPDLCLEDTELRDYGGNSIFVFFKFNKFIAWLIFIFFCLALINFGIYAGDQNPDFKNDAQAIWYADFFISAYTKDQRSAWLGTTIVCIIFMFFACPCYFRYIGNYKFEDENRSLAEVEEDAVAAGNTDDAITRYNDDGTIDVTSRYRPYSSLFLRRFASLIVFAGFIAVQVFASIGITQIEGSAKDAGPAFAIAVIAAVLNMIYTVMARQLTEFEKWTDIGSSDKSLTMKLILFKLANVIAVYGSKRYPTDRCVYEIVGEQFLTLLFVEIVLVVPGTMVGAALLTRYHQLYGRILGSINGDAMHMAQFEMAIEYLATIYKFYLGCMALVTFPLSTVLTIVVLFFNFWAARYRLIKICSKPIRSTATMRGTVTMVMVLIFFAALFTPFAGAVWIMAGWAASRTRTTFYCGLTD